MPGNAGIDKKRSAVFITIAAHVMSYTFILLMLSVLMSHNQNLAIDSLWCKIKLMSIGLIKNMRGNGIR